MMSGQKSPLGENDELRLQKIESSKHKIISYWRKNRKVKAKRQATGPKIERFKITKSKRKWRITGIKIARSMQKLRAATNAKIVSFKQKWRATGAKIRRSKRQWQATGAKLVDSQQKWRANVTKIALSERKWWAVRQTSQCQSENDKPIAQKPTG